MEGPLTKQGEASVRHLGLFEGIGGFSLAARWMGWETIAWVEIDPFCQAVLKKHFPNAKGHGDIKEFDGTEYRGAVDILTGGFPCQPWSVAGRRGGKDDARFLWPEMLRVIDEIEPAGIVGENVSGSRELVDEICAALEHRGYETEPISIEAAGVGAKHIRERFWFIAYTDRLRLQGSQLGLSQDKRERNINAAVLPSLSLQPTRFEDDLPEPYVIGGSDGIPNRVDRIKGLGNAIVPQVAYEIFKAIASVKQTNTLTPKRI